MVAETPSYWFILTMCSDNRRSRNWLFTINEVLEETEELVGQLATKRGVQYLVYGREVAPTTGHKHLQGFVRFKNARKFRELKKFFGNLKPRLDCGDGKAVTMMNYCKKDGDYVEYGKPPRTSAEAGAEGGQKSAELYKRMIKLAEKGELDQIKKLSPGMYTRYYRTWQQIFKDKGKRPGDLDEVSGIWIYGPSDAGKSYYARHEFGEFFDKPINKWWDKYQGEESVLLDDFDTGHDRLAHYLKRWADRYAFSGEVKFGAVALRPKRIIVTSQYRIEEIWSDERTRDAINRRFRKIKIHIDSQGNRVIQDQGF